MLRDKDLNLETVLSPAYRQIWDNSLLGIMIMDKDGVVLYINRLLIRTDELQDVAIIGKKYGRFLSHGKGTAYFHSDDQKRQADHQKDDPLLLP
ncbi:hypothetical protein DSCA_61890 [Desulfosarcina alkanivorans]|uniref:PAS domain-containing protein n=1 Tax=Desulfosarcina alkanivorans TaxID=571177 RepID=A0A5K7YW35_9BACT|nr:hypothetical protein DSCA_61890 [Desulfosarcina alkanivorans]